jgi:hypothetical protein
MARRAAGAGIGLAGVGRSMVWSAGLGLFAGRTRMEVRNRMRRMLPRKCAKLATLAPLLMALCLRLLPTFDLPDNAPRQPEAQRNDSPAPALAAAAFLLPVNYQRDILPIFAANCFACHGPAAESADSDTTLRLDRRADAVTTAIVPGDAERSPLAARIASSNPKRRMPPPGANRSALTADQIHLIRRWIDEGAAYEQHWAFTPIRRPTVPRVVASAGWVRNPIDAFVASAHERHGLRPSLEADRAILLRRLSFDLTGLPPEPEDAAALAASESESAYEQLVDRLLASPHYGERMAILWLDLVRYADTDGYSMDHHRDVWMYRDYAIDAFNRNVPFDRFSIQQLAGDLLARPSAQDRIASGYNRLLMTSQEGCADPKEYVHRYAADRVRNLGSVWLGMTLGCAECHDHKFDPLRARDFYRLAAFFADIQEKGVGPLDFTRFPDARQEAELRELDEQIGRLERAPADESLQDLQERRTALLRMVPATLVSTSGPPRTVRVLPRGNWADDSGSIATAGLPPALAGAIDTERPLTRLDLAHWLVAGENPLVARVFVNRLWKLAFGRGLVATCDDFGTRGTQPTHPELLDWLAAEFQGSGWDVKHMLRLIVTSSTYRQSSQDDAELLARDPDNRWLTRQNRCRLDAEFIRDNALVISGLLARRIGGRSVKPYQPEGFWASRFTEKEYRPDVGADQYRRGLYTYLCRNYLHPSLQAFDAPSRRSCTADRGETSTPLQALVLLNDPTYAEAARALASRILREGGTTTAARLAHAYRLALGRPVTPEEVAVLTRLLEKHRAELKTDAAAVAGVLTVGDSPVIGHVDQVELAAWASVARVILNLHETITRK